MAKKTKPVKKGFWERVKEASAQQQATAEREKAAKQKQSDKAEGAKPAAAVEKTPQEKRKIYRDGIVKTIIPAVLGTAAGFFSFFKLGDGTLYPWLSIMLFVIILSYYAQRVLYPMVGVDVKEFGNKDWFYVEFITIDFWLVVWTLLLN